VTEGAPTLAAPGEPARRRDGRPTARQRALRLTSQHAILGLCLVYFAVVWAIVPAIASPQNLQNLLANALPLLAVTLGQTFVLITGGIDLSATAVIALASVAGASVVAGPEGAPALLGVLAMLAVGGGVGLANGLAVTRLAMPPFMLTLTVMMFGGGVAIWATGGQPVTDLPSGFTLVGKGSLGDVVPYALFVVGALALGADRLLARTLFGRWLYALGGNLRAARLSGVRTERTITLAYVASGLGAAVASLLYTGRLETGSPVLGQRIFLDVIGAAVIGGTSLFGGKGSVAGVAVGVLFIALIDNSFTLLGLSSFVVLMAKGAVILLAAGIDVARVRLAGGR
jgi:ribose/xylose/arabinose/galactoside ABC-type transport system permease subunit